LALPVLRCTLPGFTNPWPNATLFGTVLLGKVDERDMIIRD
jgi:hypothetical protein